MLNLHSGGELVTFEQLREVETPPATPTHVPIEHHRLVSLVRGTLHMFGHEIVEEHFALDHDGQRFFGLMELRSEYGDYTDTLGLRNSSDKSFPIGIAFGAKCFVCSNLSFLGDHVIRRKHTANAKRELPGLLMEIIEPLAEQREAQHRTFERYQATDLLQEEVDHAIMQLWRDGVIGVQRIADVHEQWERPAFDWGEKTAYRLFNSVTHALTGRVAENPSVIGKLHQVIDAVCETVH